MEEEVIVKKGLKIQFPKEVIDFFKKYGNMITLNYETHVYFGHPWFKLDVGSNMAEVFWNLKDYPEELRNATYGPPQKGAIAICSKGFKGLITARSPMKVDYSDGKSEFAWTGIYLESNEQADVLVGDPWSSRNPIVIGHIDTLN